MKRIILTVLFFLLLLTVSYGYDTNNYSIDFPSNYHYAAEGSYSSQEGNNINIKVVPYTDIVYFEDVYNEEAVENAKSSLSTLIDNMKSGVIATVKQRYPGVYTDDQLQQIEDSIKLGTIYEAKIAKISKNNYDSIMLFYSYYMLDEECFVLTHSVTDKKNIYIITVGGNTKDHFEKTEIKNALNSFTIKNYTPLLHKNNSNEIKTENKKTSNLCENENYSIIMPESYNYSSEGSYSSNEGYNINIKVHKYSEYPEMADLESEVIYYEDIYNNEMVEYYKQNITSTFYNSMNNAAEKQKKQHEGQISGKIIDSAYNTMKFGSIIASDITTISINKYPAIRIAYTFSLLDENKCMWQYIVFDKTRIIGLSVSGSDETYISKEYIQKSIDSFTIKNYSPFEKKSSVTSTTSSNSSKTNTSTSSSSTSNNSNYNNSFSLANIVLSILLTLISYMFFPLLIKLCNGDGFESTTAKKIALWNSIIIGGTFFFFTSSQGIQWSVVPALLYYAINSAVLAKKKDANNSEIRKEETNEEKSQEDLYTINHPTGIAPKISNQNTIDKPTEEIELDSKEIPWELQDENNNMTENEMEDKAEFQNSSEIEESKKAEKIIEDACNTVSKMKEIMNNDTSDNNKKLNSIGIKDELERVEILEKYQKLLKEGLITEEEFNKMKDKLLNL